jgi:bacteriorhodopsin
VPPVQPAAAAAPVITFPEDYPNSVRPFLLIGFLGNIISAGVFFFLSTAKEHRSVIGSFTWMTCAIAALAYYAMYAGVGVQYKTTDVTPRVIFWARYVDRFATTPLLLCALSAFAKAEFPVLVSLLGADIIMMSCLALGAFVAGPDKYFWWVGALVLFVVMVSQLLTMLAKVEDEKRKEVMRTLTWLTIICWVGYIVLWLLGSEGTAALGLSQEVGLTCILDLVAKAGVLFYLVSNQDASDEAKGTGLTLA